MRYDRMNWNLVLPCLDSKKVKILNRKSQVRCDRILRNPPDEIGIYRGQSGFTLVEVMVSVAIIVVVALGTLCFQYQGVKHSRTAEAQITATRLGQLLLEDWKSTGGATDYDPVSLGLGFAAPASPNLGYYRITLDNQTFFLQMTQSEIDHDDVAGVRLSQLRVTTKWRRDFTMGVLGIDDQTITLTTYIRRD